MLQHRCWYATDNQQCKACNCSVSGAAAHTALNWPDMRLLFVLVVAKALVIVISVRVNRPDVRHDGRQSHNRPGHLDDGGSDGGHSRHGGRCLHAAVAGGVDARQDEAGVQRRTASCGEACNPAKEDIAARRGGCGLRHAEAGHDAHHPFFGRVLRELERAPGCVHGLELGVMQEPGAAARRGGPRHDEAQDSGRPHPHCALRDEKSFESRVPRVVGTPNRMLGIDDVINA